MFLADLFLALFIGLILALIFSIVLQRPGPWANFWAFFVIIFLAAWTGGIWVTPIGPEIYGIYWFPFLMVGLIFATLLAAASPNRAIAEREAANAAIITFSLFFWIFLLLLLGSVIGGYLR